MRPDASGARRVQVARRKLRQFKQLVLRRADGARASSLQRSLERCGRQQSNARDAKIGAAGDQCHFTAHKMVDTGCGRHCFFDLETTGVGPDAQITCGATAWNDGSVKAWHGEAGKTMPSDVAIALARELLGADEVYTFNGAAFDLRLLYQLSKVEELKQLALRHRDLMVDFWAENRYFTSMESLAAPTLGVGKSNNGGWAATAWFDGEHEAVLDYCKRDVEVLRELIAQATLTGKLTRVSKAGRKSAWVLPSLDGTVRTVSAASAAVAPAPTWMKTEPKPGPDLSWTR